MYGQMTAGSWIYIGTQGIVQGTYETFAAAAQRALRRRRDLRGHAASSRAGLGGMGGAQPLAVDDGRRRVPRRRGRSDAHPAPARDPLPRRAGAAISTTRCARCERAQSEGRALSVGARGQRAPMSARAGARAASCPISSPIRPRRTIRCAATSRPGVELGAGGRRCGSAIRRSTSSGARASMAVQVERDGRDAEAPARTCSTTATTCARRPSSPASTDAFDVSRASCRRTSGRCSARARGRSAGPRCRAIRTTSRVTDEAVLAELFPDDRACCAAG